MDPSLLIKVQHTLCISNHIPLLPSAAEYIIENNPFAADSAISKINC